MKTRWLNFGAVVCAMLGTVLLSALDDTRWGAACFIGALAFVSLATGRVP